MIKSEITAATLPALATEFDKVVAFLQSIGIPVRFCILEEDNFLPGLRIAGASIAVDPEKLKFPGDILHEAGHIAVVPSAERDTLTHDSIAKREMKEAEEMMAIAWSYAACVHLGIDPGFVFHDQGYKGAGSHIAVNFRNGNYFGVSMLQWTGMAREKVSEMNPGEPVYPAMLKWLRE